MRFLETLIVVIVSIYLAQLTVTALVLTTILMGLWCLYTRPKEALLLGFGLLAVALLSSWSGLVASLAVGASAWVISRWKCARRRPPLLAGQRNAPESS